MNIVLAIVMLFVVCVSNVFSGTVITVGYPATDPGGDAGGSYQDAKTYIDPPYPNGTPSASCIKINGKLVSWRLFAKNTGDILLQVYRPVKDGYKLIGQNHIIIKSKGDITVGDVTVLIKEDEQISVQKGDFLGYTGGGIPEIVGQIGNYGVWKTYDKDSWPSYAGLPWPTATTIDTIVESREWNVNPPDPSLNDFKFIEYPGAAYDGSGNRIASPRPHSLSADIEPE